MTVLEDPKQVGERRQQDQRAQRYGSEGEPQRRGGRGGARDGQVRGKQEGILTQSPPPEDERDLNRGNNAGYAPRAPCQSRERGDRGGGGEPMQRDGPPREDQPVAHQRRVSA